MYKCKCRKTSNIKKQDNMTTKVIHNNSEVGEIPVKEFKIIIIIIIIMIIEIKEDTNSKRIQMVQ
jgi:hypothetical protein